ncbi:hypothetical protein FB451DRAFT_1527619 [Mycena latifolia]|nr:hypothetical protein FB451DRAFT_1527619 [Mycena latifolia]
MSPGLLRVRAPYRPKNALLAFVAGVYAYALAAVKQDTFDDLDDAVRRAAISAEDERRAMQMAAAHATGGLVGCDSGGRDGCDDCEGGTKASEAERARTGGCSGASTNICGEGDAGFDAAWGAPRAARPDPQDARLRRPSYEASHAAQLVASSRALRALDAESELDAWTLDGLKSSGHSSPSISFVSFVGFLGALRNKPSHVRLYHDCSTADLAFTAFLTVLAVYAKATSRARSSRSSRPTRRARALPSRSRACSSSPPPACTSSPPPLPPPRLYRTGRYHRGGCDAPLPPNVRAADVVYAPVHVPAGSALERSVGLWVRASPRRRRSCSTRYTASPPPAYLRLPPPPPPSVRAIPALVTNQGNMWSRVKTKSDRLLGVEKRTHEDLPVNHSHQ